MPKLSLPKEQTFTAPALIWKRMLAFVIDIMIINLFVFLPFRGILMKAIPSDYGFSEAYNAISSESMGNITTAVFFMGFFAMMYFVLLERKMGQTVGKYLLRIRVEGTEKETRAWQFYARSLFIVPVFPFILLWAIDPLLMMFSKSSQRLSEIMSRTRTVETFEIKKEW